jgi:DNA polymerase
MIDVSIDGTFESWRRHARELIERGVRPEAIVWSSLEQNALFAPKVSNNEKRISVRVPAGFIDLAKAAACFDDPSRWSLLYTLLFRLANENPKLLSIESDPDTRRVQLMAKAVRRDVHKFHAFVRFRRVECDEQEIFVAWHEPHHHTVEMATPFFARRFGSMNFSILTPRGCAHWDKKHLTFSDGVDRTRAPAADDAEDFWLI